MPELPEVETVKQGLAEQTTGHIIQKVVLSEKKLRLPYPDNFPKKLKGRTITAITRRAKYLLINLDDGNVIIAHLGMSGKLVVNREQNRQEHKHDHAIFYLNNNKTVIFNDPRRFGLITLASQAEFYQHKLFCNLGIEPLIDEFNGKTLYHLIKDKKTSIKTAIMDASIVVGIGNIYACEALFKSNIHPLTLVCQVTEKACERLVVAIKDVLNDAIKSGGSTLRDYSSVLGEAGYFQHKFSVYGRENEACYICNKAIKRIKQNGRSSFYCGTCQKITGK